MQPATKPAGDSDVLWPRLDYLQWRETAATLHLWTQVVGKIRLSRTPWLNHSWHVALYVTARGLGTSPIDFGSEQLDIEFDFVSHVLHLRATSGAVREIALEPQSVSAFYRKTMTALEELGMPVTIDVMPNEIEHAIPFPDDEVHAAYDSEAAHRFWRILVQADRVLKRFRTGFLGKCSPVHFFWGSFDLAVTRFSGRIAPLHPGGVPNLSDAIAQEAYSHEVSSAGFWPGNDAFPQAAFYSYAYPEPPGFRDVPVEPSAASFNATLGEFILPYEAVRVDPSPDDAIMSFLQSTYAAAATTARWDSAALECQPGVPGRPRRVR